MGRGGDNTVTQLPQDNVLIRRRSSSGSWGSFSNLKELRDDLTTLRHLWFSQLGKKKANDHAARLESFYGPQATACKHGVLSLGDRMRKQLRLRRHDHRRIIPALSRRPPQTATALPTQGLRVAHHMVTFGPATAAACTFLQATNNRHMRMCMHKKPPRTHPLTTPRHPHPTPPRPPPNPDDKFRSNFLWGRRPMLAACAARMRERSNLVWVDLGGGTGVSGGLGAHLLRCYHPLGVQPMPLLLFK